ncbi:ABC transporter ATP-binding protein [Pyrodictium abyssi]|uniref:Nickel import system ATP-binding protein NikD n=1 Tax=Pyrodictium abyssi TaxID=54256 RepID=A0ABM8IX95_9CREN|nr:ABC transporter ATP-binding protein [Pyrodictium abyssi]
MADAVLRVEGLSVYYYTLRGIVRAVEGAWLEAHRGELVAVVGESGSGKSTLGFSLLRLVPPPGRIVAGRILVDGVDITRLEGDELRRARGELVSIVFQDPFTTLDPVRRIGDQLLEVLLEHGVPKEEARGRVPQLLESVGLPREAARAYPHQLSGGQRQRVSIAAAIALEPKVLVADEPTTALDVIVQKQIMDLLDELRRRHGMAVVLVTHDIALAAERATSIAIMYAGKIVEQGPAEEVLREPLHPYTRALLESVPDIDNPRWPRPIPGQPPDLRRPPPGCRFAPRCLLATEKCRSEEPPTVSPGQGRRVACWLHAS